MPSTVFSCTIINKYAHHTQYAFHTNYTQGKFFGHTHQVGIHNTAIRWTRRSYNVYWNSTIVNHSCIFIYKQATISYTTSCIRDSCTTSNDVIDDVERADESRM